MLYGPLSFPIVFLVVFVVFWGGNFPFPMTLSCCHMFATSVLLHLLRWAKPEVFPGLRHSLPWQRALQVVLLVGRPGMSWSESVCYMGCLSCLVYLIWCNMMWTQWLYLQHARISCHGLAWKKTKTTLCTMWSVLDFNWLHCLSSFHAALPAISQSFCRFEGSLLAISVVLSNSAAVLLSVAFVNMLKGDSAGGAHPEVTKKCLNSQLGPGGSIMFLDNSEDPGRFQRTPGCSRSHLTFCWMGDFLDLSGGNPVIALILGLALGTSSCSWQMLCPVLVIMFGAAWC